MVVPARAKSESDIKETKIQSVGFHYGMCSIILFQYSRAV